LIRTEEMTDRGNEHDVGVAWIDDDPADGLRLSEPHVAPRGAAVDRAIDAVAPGRALAIVRLARSRPHDIRIAWRDRNVADRHRAAVAIESCVPRRPVILAAKDSAPRAGDEDDAGIAGHGLDVVHAPPERGRTDL